METKIAASGGSKKAIKNKKIKEKIAKAAPKSKVCLRPKRSIEIQAVINPNEPTIKAACKSPD